MYVTLFIIIMSLQTCQFFIYNKEIEKIWGLQKSYLPNMAVHKMLNFVPANNSSLKVFHTRLSIVVQWNLC